jgi:amino acid adenylation domain-containing protein
MQEEKIQGFRLSPQQRRLWLLQRDDAAYCAQTVISLSGQLDAPALKMALRNVIARHEILRTTFRRPPGINVPFQVLADELDPAWRVFEWREHSAQQQQKNLCGLFEEELRWPFDLEHGPVVRASLIALGAQKHMLALSLPALHADGRTLSNLLGELSRAYAGLAQGSAPTDEPVQFVQFSEWQHELLEDEEAEEGRAFWRKQDFQTPLQTALPFEEKPAAQSPFRPQVHAARLKPELWHEAEGLALRCGASVANIMLAAWQALLWRLTGQDELVIGQVVDGRKYEELEDALGPFAKSLPIHSRLTNKRSFLDALKQLDDSTAEAQSWQEYFVWESRAATAPDVSEPNFFPFAFEFERRSEPQRGAGVEFSVEQQRSYTDRFKLKAHGVQLGEALALELHYDPSYYAAEVVARVASYFETFLESALKTPEAPLGELEILSEADRRELLETFNRTATPRPQDACIHQLFEQQAARHPQSAAVTFAGRTLTYGQLNERANQLAHYLRALGVGPDAPVGISVERSPEMIVGILGILKAGGAYVPLDPTYPEERLSFILEDTQAPVLLTQQHLAENLAGRQARVVCLDSDWERIARESAENPSAASHPDNLAYIIYTSGSTGRPKGVLISHRNLVHSTAARLMHYREPVRCFLLLSSFSFDSSVAGIFWTLCQGGELCLPPEGAQLDVVQLASLIEAHRVSHLLCLPSLYSFLIKLAKPRQLGSLRAVIVAGEACARELTESHHELMPQTSLFNEYGPTEGAVWSSVYESTAEKPRPVVPIGLPIPNMRMHILDGQLRPVPIGMPGEVYIGGDGLARGYLRRPALSAERFIPDPFGKEAGALPARRPDRVSRADRRSGQDSRLSHRAWRD